MMCQIMSSYKPLEKNMFTYYSITVPKLTIMSKHLINRKLLNELHHHCLMCSIFYFADATKLVQ